MALRAQRGAASAMLGVLMHDGNAVAAEFERDPAQAGGGLDFGADARGAGEGDEIDSGVAHQRRPDGFAIEHVEHAGRSAGIDEDLRQLRSSRRATAAAP